MIEAMPETSRLLPQSSFLMVRGEDGGEWVFQGLASGGGKVVHFGAVEVMLFDCEAELDAPDFLRFASGESNPQELYVRGRLRLSGSVEAGLSFMLVLEKLIELKFAN